MKAPLITLALGFLATPLAFSQSPPSPPAATPAFDGRNWHPPKLPVVAHFRFDGNAKDLKTSNPPMELKNIEYRENALYLNGIYENTKDAKGYRAVATTPKLDFLKFSVAMKFKPESFDTKSPTANKKEDPFDAKSNVLLTGGVGYRWFGLSCSKAGHLSVAFNNGRFSQEIDAVSLAVNEWSVVACSVDIAHRKVVVFVNGKKVSAIDLPSDFKLDIVASKDAAKEKNWTFANYSYGGTFHGLIDEFVVYDGALAEADLARAL